jgi:hypothetical protein
VFLRDFFLHILWLYKHNILFRRTSLKGGWKGKVVRVPSNLWCFSLFNLLPNSYTGEIGVQYRLYLTVASKHCIVRFVLFATDSNFSGVTHEIGCRTGIESVPPMSQTNCIYGLPSSIPRNMNRLVSHCTKVDHMQYIEMLRE